MRRFAPRAPPASSARSASTHRSMSASAYRIVERQEHQVDARAQAHQQRLAAMPATQRDERHVAFQRNVARMHGRQRQQPLAGQRHVATVLPGAFHDEAVDGRIARVESRPCEAARNGVAVCIAQMLRTTPRAAHRRAVASLARPAAARRRRARRRQIGSGKPCSSPASERVLALQEVRGLHEERLDRMAALRRARRASISARASRDRSGTGLWIRSSARCIASG